MSHTRVSFVAACLRSHLFSSKQNVSEDSEPKTSRSLLQSQEMCNMSIYIDHKYGSLSSRYVAASHSVYAVLLAPRLIHALTYSTVCLPFHVHSSFSYFLMLQVKLCFQPRRLQRQGPASAASKHLLLWIHVSGSGLHMRHGSFSLLQSVTPLPYSVSSWAGMHSQMWRTFLLALALKTTPPFSTSFHPHTHTLDPWVFSGIFCRLTKSLNCLFVGWKQHMDFGILHRCVMLEKYDENM